MAGEFCGQGCGWCGRCDAEPDNYEMCNWCGRSDCPGDCPQYFEAIDDEPYDERIDDVA